MTRAKLGVGGRKAAATAFGLLYVLTALAILATARPSADMRATGVATGSAAPDRNPSGVGPSP